MAFSGFRPVALRRRLSASLPFRAYFFLSKVRGRQQKAPSGYFHPKGAIDILKHLRQPGDHTPLSGFRPAALRHRLSAILPFRMVFCTLLQRKKYL
jgi:hypothetical protein